MWDNSDTAEAVSASRPTGLEPRPRRLTRIGDAERDEAARALGEHFAAGRLDRDELDGRLEAAYAARTGADLDRLFADLPSTPQPATSPRTRGPVSPHRWARVPLVPVLLVSLLLGLAVFGIVRGGTPPFVLIPLLWVLWFRVGARAWWRFADPRTGRGGTPSGRSVGGDG